MKIIDPHVHLFALSAGQYHWLKPENPPYWPDKTVICREFRETDLTLSPPVELAGFVHIEAGFDNAQPWRETDWLEQYCTLPFRSVAGIDLLADDFSHTLDELVKRPSTVGVRHILDDQAADILSQSLIPARFNQLAAAKLSFDVQFDFADGSAVAALLKVMESAPAVQFIINHAGLPLPASKANWFNNINKLASYPNLTMKLSGWEMHARERRNDWVKWVLESTLNTFGENRLMLASNFPLCLWSGSYDSLWQSYLQLLGEAAARRLFHDNAAHIYRL